MKHERLPSQVKRVIAKFNIPKGAMTAPLQVLLCELRDTEAVRFVVWIRNLQTGGCFSGNYFKTLKQGVERFTKQIKLEVRH